MILAGDAIQALAEACAGTSGAALSSINARLSELCIEAECMSLSAEGIRLSANDLLKLGAALAESETFCAYSAVYMDEIVHEKGNNRYTYSQPPHPKHNGLFWHGDWIFNGGWILWIVWRSKRGNCLSLRSNRSTPIRLCGFQSRRR